MPVRVDGDRAVADSWTIDTYSEDAYPNRPSPFGGDGGSAMAGKVAVDLSPFSGFEGLMQRIGQRLEIWVGR